MTIRIGIIGTGGMGQHHARQIVEREAARVVALCDTEKDSIERLKQALGNVESLIGNNSLLILKWTQ